MSFWLDRKVQPPAHRPDGSTRHDPDFVIEGFSAVKMNPNGTRRYALAAKRMVHFPDDNSTQLELPRLVYFDYQRAPVTIRSETAEAMQGGDEGFFRGDVHIIRSAYVSNDELGVLTRFQHAISAKDLGKQHKPGRSGE